MIVLKNHGLVKVNDRMVINGAFLNSSDCPKGVEIMLGLDTMGGIYLLNCTPDTVAVMVDQNQIGQMKLRATAFYLNAPEFDRIEIATHKGSYFLHFRRLQARDLEDTPYAWLPTDEAWRAPHTTVTHFVHISTSENPHTVPLELK